MEPEDFFRNLSQSIPRPVRLKLINQCLAKSAEKSCRIERPQKSIIAGVFNKGTLTEFCITQNSIKKYSSFSSIISLTIRFQTRKFKTDVEISKNSKFLRELQEWNNDGLEIVLENEDRNWDQFETNKRKYGVISTYDEELYTTKKVHKSQLSKEQINRALKIEKELALKERKDVEETEDEEKMFSAVIGTGRFIEKKPDSLLTRERATSMGSLCEISKEDYKKKRQYLMNRHKAQNKFETDINFLESLDLTIARPTNEGILQMFEEFKELKYEEKKLSRDKELKDLKEFSNKINNKRSLYVIQEEAHNTLPISIIDTFFQSWKVIQNW